MLKIKPFIIIAAFIIIFVITHLSFTIPQATMRIGITTSFGGIAYILMTIAIFLSTRAKFIEKLFGGLDRMYQAHRFLGIATGLFILIHFLGIPEEIEKIDSSTYELFPSKPLGIAAMVSISIAMIITLNRKIPYEKWKNTHKIMGLVYIMSTGHFITTPDVFFYKGQPSYIILIVTSIVGLTSLIYSYFIRDKKTEHLYTIENVVKNVKTTELTLKPSNGNITFKPGQFAFVKIQGKGWQEAHPFTISSSPKENSIKFTIKVLGDWTRKIRNEITTGKRVKIYGPYGCFDTNKGLKSQIWIAGGIGITPYLSMLRSMEKDDDRTISLFYAVRNINETTNLNEIKEKYLQIKGLKLFLLESDNEEYVNIDFIRTNTNENFDNMEIFICGPKAMTKSLIKEFKKEGIKRNKIHSEAFELR